MKAHPDRSLRNVRPEAVAGAFYPNDAGELRSVVDRFISGSAEHASPAKAYVLPHAGYEYSGAVAGTGYRLLQSERGRVRRVILIGPSHYLAFRGIAVSDHDGFQTPLGIVPVDREAIDSVRDLPQVVELNEAHRREHSLEVHLPFLQSALGAFSVVPLVAGDADEQQVKGVVDRCWGGPDTRIVVSSDLSHYHEYHAAQDLDRETAKAIEALRMVRTDQACGAIPLNGLLVAARSRGMRVRTLDLRNSGDTAGPRDRVVGYGAFAVD